MPEITEVDTAMEESPVKEARAVKAPGGLHVHGVFHEYFE